MPQPQAQDSPSNTPVPTGGAERPGPWTQFPHPADGPWTKYGTPDQPVQVANQGTIGPPKGPDPLKPTNLIDRAIHYSDPIENYTQEGRAEHPVLSRIGDVTSGLKELMLGGQTAGKPMGTRAGLLDEATLLGTGPGMAEMGAGIENRVRGIRPRLSNMVRDSETREILGKKGLYDKAINKILPDPNPKIEPQGPQQMGLTEFDKVHGKKLSLAEKAREQEITQQAGLREQDAAAKNRRTAVERREAPRLIKTEQEFNATDQRQRARTAASEPEAKTRGMESAAYGKKGNRILKNMRETP